MCPTGIPISDFGFSPRLFHYSMVSSPTSTSSHALPWRACLDDEVHGDLSSQLSARPSTIGAHAGMGLFVSSTTSVPAGAILCVYSGDHNGVLTSAQAELVIDKSYLMRLAPNRFINGKQSGSMARFINDCRDKRHYNATFVKMPERECALVVATRDIKPDEEIFASYGAAYWFGRRKILHPSTLSS